MALAVDGGHVSRAIDFYNSPGKYFIIGGTTAWDDETSPDAPSPSEFKLRDVVGLKRVDTIHLVIPSDDGSIHYRDQNWKIVPLSLETTVSSAGVTIGSTVVPVASVAGMTVGSKLRIGNVYEGKIVSISGLLVTLDVQAPQAISSGSRVIGGAQVEGAKYVYLDCTLNYDAFPLVTYRQIGLCSKVTPATEDVLRAASYSLSGQNEYTSLGILEIIDNRVPSTRDINQRDMLSLIIEF